MIVVLLGPIMIQHMVIIRLCLAKCTYTFFQLLPWYIFIIICKVSILSSFHSEIFMSPQDQFDLCMLHSSYLYCVKRSTPEMWYTWQVQSNLEWKRRASCDLMMELCKDIIIAVASRNVCSCINHWDLHFHEQICYFCSSLLKNKLTKPQKNL